MQFESRGVSIMTAPSVKELPKAGARLSRPNTFSTDAEIFLSKLPDFRVQVNQLSSYLNYTANNKYNKFQKYH